MCTYITEKARLLGSAKGPRGWMRVDEANVYFDHPVHAPLDHALNIDFVPANGAPDQRVAVELSAESARGLVQAILAALESGTRAFCFGTGLAAITAVTRLLKPGEQILACDDLYGGTYRLFSRILANRGISVNYVDFADEQALRAALTPAVNLVYLESPTNPLLHILDLERIATLAHQHGARVAVDNSTMSPYLQRPLELGCDIVIHSATKHLDGQGRVLGGAVLGAKSLVMEHVFPFLRTAGPSISPFNAWVILKGLETLDLRMRAQSAAALELARWLESHKSISRVFYPGLESHPQHALAKRQQRAGAHRSAGRAKNRKAPGLRIIQRLFQRQRAAGGGRNTLARAYDGDTPGRWRDVAALADPLRRGSEAIHRRAWPDPAPGRAQRGALVLSEGMAAELSRCGDVGGAEPAPAPAGAEGGAQAGPRPLRRVPAGVGGRDRAGGGSRRSGLQGGGLLPPSLAHPGADRPGAEPGAGEGARVHAASREFARHPRPERQGAPLSTPDHPGTPPRRRAGRVPDGGVGARARGLHPRHLVRARRHRRAPPVPGLAVATAGVAATAKPSARFSGLPTTPPLPPAGEGAQAGLSHMALALESRRSCVGGVAGF